MKHIQLSFFPGGKTRALTMSYDDGVVADRHLISIFNTYGIRGTFHLNGERTAGKYADACFVPPEEVKTLYAGHEVAGHLATHPWPCNLPQQTLIWELSEDRRRLEELVGYPLRGISYPYGNSTAAMRELMPKLGVFYARTTNSVPSMMMPDDFLLWNPTCHHNGNLFELGNALLDNPSFRLPRRLMYVWGHAYEFDNDGNWDRIEKFCDQMAGKEDVWYATNGEIWEYDCAQKHLLISVDGGSVYNPSALDVWVGVDGKPGELGDPVCIPAGKTVQL